MLLDVVTFAMPIEQCLDGEAVPEVVHTWPSMIARAPQPDLSGQTPEDAMDVLVQQTAALLGDEEGRAAAWSEMRIAPVGVAVQRCARRRMQWNEPRFSKLGQPDRQHARVEVDFVTVEPHCLGQTHAGHRDQSEQRVVGPSPQPVLWRQRQRRRQQGIDLSVATSIWTRAC